MRTRVRVCVLIASLPVVTLCARRCVCVPAPSPRRHRVYVVDGMRPVAVVSLTTVLHTVSQALKGAPSPEPVDDAAK